eukprot:g20602.t1
MPLFQLPCEQNGWGPALSGLGPVSGGEAPVVLPKYPIENINRYPPARVGKACDFTQATQDRIRQMQARDAREGTKRPLWHQPQQPLVVEDGYNLVDTKAGARKKQTNNYSTRSRPNYQQMNQHAVKTQNYQEGILGKNTKQKPLPITKQTAKGKGKGKGFNRNRMNTPSFR